MSIQKQIKNIVISLYKIVQGQYTSYIKKYSICENKFGKYLELYLFKSCSGNSLTQLQMISKNLKNTFLKDLIINQYVDMQRTTLPEIEDMIIYGGRNQAYIGFSKNVFCYYDNIEQAIIYFEKKGYIQIEKDKFIK